MNTTVENPDLAYAVCRTPFDNTVRMAYADWCLENGLDERGEKIKSQLAGTWSPPEDMEAWANECMPTDGLTIDRGFAYRWMTTTGDFIARASDMFRVHPIVHVQLTDKYPDVSTYWSYEFGGIQTSTRGSAFWKRESANSRGDISELPPELFDSLPNKVDDFDTADQALKALSQAAVNLGRSSAGLPPLEWPK